MELEDLLRGRCMRLKNGLVAVGDLASAAMLALAAPGLALAARLRERAPLARKVLDLTKVALLPHHYYEPVITEKDLRRSLAEPRPLPGLDLATERQIALVQSLDYDGELRRIPWEKPGPTKFGFANDMYSVGDAEILYGMIRRCKPRRIIEIGSGQSTLMARLAITRNTEEQPGYACDHVCIEPYEVPWLEQVGVRVERSRVEALGAAYFEALEANDILFIDSSHIIRPQGDVLFELQEILPRLKPGVLVHVHDIFTPRDYPAEWVLRKRWLWNEQYLLESFLTFNDAFEVVVALNHLWMDHPGALTTACPHLTARGGNPGAFWIRRKT